MLTLNRVCASPSVAFSSRGSKRDRVAVRLRSRPSRIGLARSPAFRESARAVEVLDAPSHCVVETGGSDAYLYSFSDESPGALARADFESDGVKLYVSKSAVSAKRAEADAPAIEEPVEEAAPPSTDTPIGDRVIGIGNAALRVVETIWGGSSDEADPAPSEVPEEVVTLPPAVFVAAASAMKHCVLRSDGVNALYSFTEDPPANAGRPAFEAGGVKVYAASADLNVQYETPVSPAIVEQEVVPAPAPAPAPEPARDPPAASAIVSSPGHGVGGESCGKSGAAVFERGVGIAAWQGLEIGYEMDVVIEVPTVAGVESAVAGAEMAAETAPRRVWMAEPIVSKPLEGRRQMRSGAAIFGNGVGVASFEAATTDVPSDAATFASSEVVPLKDARSVGSGGVAFTGAGMGSVRFNRIAPAAGEASAASGSDGEKDWTTLAIWAACGVLFAFKLLIQPA